MEPEHESSLGGRRLGEAEKSSPVTVLKLLDPAIPEATFLSQSILFFH